jgi:hypothetical protein
MPERVPGDSAGANVAFGEHCGAKETCRVACKRHPVWWEGNAKFAVVTRNGFPAQYQVWGGGFRGFFVRSGVRHERCFGVSGIPLYGALLMKTLANPRFWDMKIKIAILTLATYMAMC